MSMSSYFSPRFHVMWVVLAASTPIWMTFTGMFEGCMHGIEDEIRWRKLYNTLSDLPKPVAAS
jgi:hypothetical protein